MNATRQSDDRNDDSGEVSYEYELGVGPARVVSKSRVTGPSNFVENAVNSSPEYRSLIRWGIFTVIFVPITMTFISKLPDIILALTAALR